MSKRGGALSGDARRQRSKKTFYYCVPINYPRNAGDGVECFSMIHDARPVLPITAGDGPSMVRVPYRVPLGEL